MIGERHSLPADYSWTDLDALGRSPAVRFFVDAMVAMEPDFRLHRGNYRQVVQVCRQSHGGETDLCLMSRIAHEEGLDCLADALTAEDGPDDLAALVEKQLPERPVADPAHPRYRVLGYAYWFRTGFGSEAMRAVSGQEDAVESLFELADEDLVESTEEYSGTLGGLARRRFHVPVNALVTARRAAERFGTWQQGRRADHAAYYLRFARQQITALSTREQWTALLALCSESDNLEAALTYLLDVGSDADVTEALKTLLPIWNRYKPAHGARNLLAAVLDRHLTTSSAELEPLKVVLADTFARRGESETAGTLLDEIASSGASARVRGLSAVASNPEEESPTCTPRWRRPRTPVRCSRTPPWTSDGRSTSPPGPTPRCATSASPSPTRRCEATTSPRGGLCWRCPSSWRRSGRRPPPWDTSNEPRPSSEGQATGCSSRSSRSSPAAVWYAAWRPEPPTPLVCSAPATCG
ncbi:hypothetical protein ACFQ9X_33365 [Catenulispora yoronensis]